MRYVNLSNDTGTTPSRSAVLTIDAVARSIVMPVGARAWMQWSAFFPGNESKVARVDWLVVTFDARVHPFDPFDVAHRATGAMELEAGARAVEIRVSGIPAGGAFGVHLDGIHHA